MSRATAGTPAAATTIAALAALIIGLAAGIPAGLYAITRDWDVTGHVIVLDAVIAAGAVDLLWIASTVKRLTALYRAEKRAVAILAGLPDVEWERVTEMVLDPAGESS